MGYLSTQFVHAGAVDMHVDMPIAILQVGAGYSGRGRCAWGASCTLRLHCRPGGRANKALGYCIAGRAVVVGVVIVELVYNGMQEDGLFVYRENRVCRDRYPVI